MVDKNTAFILWFDQLGIEDIKYVGGKNASLGEMYINLTTRGVRIPNGFAVTATAYHYLLDKAGVRDKIKKILSDLNTHNIKNLQERGYKVREIIKNTEFPPELRSVIVEAYGHLCKQYGENTDVAVRSSATAEDLPDASFAGQQETYLNIKGEEQLIDACKRCFASLFTNRAISYRVDKGFDHFSIGLSIGVQKMVRSDMACSGVMFSIDTESGFKDAIFVTGAYGLGENVVQGAVNPDEFYVHKPTLRQGFKPIIMRKIGEKAIKMIYTTDSKHPTKNVNVSPENRKVFCINDDEVLSLARMAQTIEDHYSWKAGHFKPMDMEWAKDGQSGELFIVQARPETVHSQKDVNVLENYELKEKGEVIITGKSVGSKIGSGKAHIIKDAHRISEFEKGEVLITDMTDPDWEPIMKIASAIVTNRGGRTCFSGDTKLLTNEGFKTFENVFNGYEGLKVPSLNRVTLKIEWKEVKAVMKKQSRLIKTQCSQTGRMNGNFLRITPDHKMLNIRGAELVDTDMSAVLADNECLLVAQRLPSLKESTTKEQMLAYFLGGIMTDGHIYQSKTHGEVAFIQKPTLDKQRFILKMNDCLNQVYGEKFKETKKKESSGEIRGKTVVGNANSYRCYSKLLAREVQLESEAMVQSLLTSDELLSYNFLAGVIDGDGTYSNGRVNIYVSKQELLEPIIVSCLRVGIVPQVTTNRSIYNVQIVEQLDRIGEFTNRVKCKDKRKTENRFFNAKQLFKPNVSSDINNRVNKNLLIGTSNLRKNTALFSSDLKQRITNLLNSDMRQTRVSFVEELGFDDVYNITVEDNHNYIVFTDRYTPVLANNCHAAIISRELGIPCVVGTNNATELVKPDQKVTVDCSQGAEGYVYDGLLKFDIKKTTLDQIPKTKTKIMMNLASPEQAFEQSFIPNDGVGLAREEFIINSYIKVHPLALLKFDQLKDEEVKNQIREITYGYKNREDFFVDKLAEGVGMIAAAFYPKKVIVRLSDFKSNEYANLIGGAQFEPKEDNPMIGWRGASRYYSENYKEAFGLECKAMLKVRKEMGLKNLEIMIPFPRTVEETKKVIATMAQYGLKQGEDGLRIIGMCEIPSNVILADEFLDVLDGFSIGTNDLTQLTLGVDRDSELVAHVYDERNEAVKRLVKQVIEVANKKGKYIGICGQSVSDYVEFAEYVVQCGIQTMSLNPDTVIKTTIAVAKLEKKLGISTD